MFRREDPRLPATAFVRAEASPSLAGPSTGSRAQVRATQIDGTSGQPRHGLSPYGTGARAGTTRRTTAITPRRFLRCGPERTAQDPRSTVGR